MYMYLPFRIVVARLHSTNPLKEDQGHSNMVIIGFCPISSLAIARVGSSFDCAGCSSTQSHPVRVWAFNETVESMRSHLYVNYT